MCVIQSELKPAQTQQQQTNTPSSASLTLESADDFACVHRKTAHTVKLGIERDRQPCLTVRNSCVYINANLFHLLSGPGELCVKESISVYMPAHMCFSTRVCLCACLG